MKRKVVKHGPSTLTISLPSKWCRENDVSEGDELDIDILSTKITIQKDIEGQISKVSANFEGLSNRVMIWLLSAFHKKGYDEIKIFFSDEKTLEAIKNIQQTLMNGFTIVENTSSFVVLRSISKEDKEVFQYLLRRCFYVTLNMAKELLEAMSSNDFSKIERIKDIEKTNNQLCNYCERAINKGLIEKDSCFYYTIIWNLEKICDDYKYICEIIEIDKDKVSKEIVALLSEVVAYLEDYTKIFFNFDFQKLEKAYKKKAAIRKMSHYLEKKLKAGEIHLFSLIFGNFLKITDISTSMVAINAGRL